MTLTPDNAGLIGTLVAFVFMASSFLAALFVFCLLWKKKRLNFDEEPATTMLNDRQPGDFDDRC